MRPNNRLLKVKKAMESLTGRIQKDPQSLDPIDYQGDIHVLGLRFNGADVRPGTTLSRAVVDTAPEISFNYAAPGKDYVVVAIRTSTLCNTLNLLTPMPHWIQPGFRRLADSPSKLIIFQPKVSRAVAEYQMSTPRIGSHKHIFLLYRQDPKFDADQTARGYKDRARTLWGRIRYSLGEGNDDRSAPLGKLVAMSWVDVKN